MNEKILKNLGRQGDEKGRRERKVRLKMNVFYLKCKKRKEKQKFNRL